MKLILLYFIPFCITLDASSSIAQEWEQVGWQGGKITVIAQLGQTLYGTGGNGFYKSSDWGSTWQIFRDDLPQSAIFYAIDETISVTPPEINTSGEYFYIDNFPHPWPYYFYKPGAWYCAEKDTSWSFQEFSLIDTVIPQVLYWSKDTIFAIKYNNTYTNLLYSSINSGVTWMPVSIEDSVIWSGINSNELMVHFQKDFFLSINNKLYRTHNLGKTWDKISLPTGDSIFFELYSIQDSVLLLAFNDRLYRSSNLGSTWEAVDASLPKSHDLSDIVFIKAIGSVIFIHYSESFYASDDFGTNWQEKEVLNQYPVSFSDIFGNQHEYILPVAQSVPSTESITHFLLDSSMSKLTPKDYNFSLSDTAILLYVSGDSLYITRLNEQNGYPYTIFSDSLMLSTNNGTTWENYHTGNIALSGLPWKKSGSRLFATGLEKSSGLSCLCHSDDNGKSWTKDIGFFPNFSQPTGIRNFFVEGDTILLIHGYQRDTLLFSIDRGKSWIYLNEAGDQLFEYLYYCHGLIILSEGYTFYSTDFGFSWNILDTTGTIGIPYIFGHNWFYSQFRDTNHTSFFSLYYSTDTMKTFTRCNGLDSNEFCWPTANEGSIVFAPEKSDGNYPLYPYSYRSNDEGRNALFYSADSGKNWKQLGGYFTNATDFFSGSEYYFMAGTNELWRFPKSAAHLKVPQEKPSFSTVLLDCYPDPASREIRIQYTIPSSSNVNIRAFDLFGRQVGIISEGYTFAGSHEISWDTSSLPSGAYILRLEAGGQGLAQEVIVQH